MGMIFQTKIDESGRICTRCHKYKLWNCFRVNSSSKTGFQSSCKDCVRNDNKSNQRHFWLQTKYGISEFEFDTMLEKQNGVCGICNESPKDGENLCVDHCHITGQVRGLLCRLCNTDLGAIERHRKNMLKISMYLDFELNFQR